MREGRYTLAATRLGWELLPSARTYRPLLGSQLDQNLVGVQRWRIETVDPTRGAGWPDLDIAVDGQGFPHISYHSVWAGGDLRYARWNGASWELQTVDAEGYAGWRQSLALDRHGHPHIAYQWDDGGQPRLQALRYAHLGAQGWEVQTVDPRDALSPSLAVDAAGRPHIAYVDPASHTLRYAYWDGLAWRLEPVGTDPVFFEPSLALDTQGRPHVAYGSVGSIDGLRHAVRDPTTQSWTISVVDDQNGHIGATQCRLALDANDFFHATYAGNVVGNLRYAAWNGSAWVRETIASGQFAGFPSDLALAPDPRVLYWKSDGGLLYARRRQGEGGNTYWASTFVQPGLAGLYHDLAAGPSGALHAAFHDTAPASLAYARSVELEDPPPSPPSVWIQVPRSGARVSGTFDVSATASSSVGISHVELLVDGIPLAVDSVAPYEAEWNTHLSGNGSHTLIARATGPDGRTAEHSIQVKVINPLPREKR